MLGRLGQGGMAEVFRARDLKHEREVAIKVLRPELGQLIGPQRFQREIAIAARLAHPHILPLLDSGECEGLLYYVMPLVQGESLRDRLEREHQLPVHEAVALTRQVASALGHAHSHGVVHRDIKPENIMLTGDEVLVADFGMASALDDQGAAVSGARLTGTGIAVGTPEYMAPEQATGQPVDGRADLYALGCTLYEMLAGVPPFTGSSATAVMARHALEEPPPVRVVRRTVPDALDSALRRALAKVPADRFATVYEFSEALGEISSSVKARQSPPWRVRAVIALAALAAVAVWYAISRPAMELGPRDWVLVGEVQGPLDDPGLGRSVRELVVAGLNQSTAFGTVPREQLNQALRNSERPDTAAMDATLARELAVRTSVRVIVTGVVSRLGRETYSIVLHAISAEDGANLFSEATSAADEEGGLVRAVEDLVRRARARLGEQRAALRAERPLMAVRTPSFEAFRRYAEGLEQVGRGNWSGSIEAFREAVALDSSFASAWAAMGHAWLTSRRSDSATMAFRRALELEDRMSPVERYRLQGDIAFQMRDLGEAVRWYDLALAERPNSAPMLNNRGIYLSALGRHGEAADAFAAAAAVDPLMVGPRQIQLLNLTAELVVMGRLDSARGAASRLTGAPAQYARLLMFAATDAWDSALTVAGELVASPGTEEYVRISATGLQAAALAASGRADEAAAALGRAVDAAVGSGSLSEARWFSQAALFLCEVRGNRCGRLPAALQRDQGLGGVLLRGLSAAQAGDHGAARAMLARLQAAAQDSLRLLGWGPHYLAARIHAASGQWDSVRAVIGPAATAGEHDPFNVDRPGTLQLRWLAAEAAQRTGSLDTAAEWLRQIVAPTGLPPAHYALRGIPWAFAHSTLADLYERLGRPAESTVHRQAVARANSMGGTR